MGATDLEKKLKVDTDFETMIAKARQQMRDGKYKIYNDDLKGEMIYRLFQKK